MRFLIISGMSGAGKSRAIAALEDVGFYCVDNMPVTLIPKFAELCLASAEKYEKVALVLDVRAGQDFKKMLFESLRGIKKTGVAYEILFLDASTDVLINRYKETRRRHPLDDKGIGVREAVMIEREMLEDIKNEADYIVDTSNMSTSKLREHLINLFAGGNLIGNFIISVLSFGFKYGIPIESDLIFDVRFLPNPYYQPELKDKTGLSDDVRSYIYSSGKADTFMDHIRSLLDFLIPQYMEEGKTSLVISVGCTGGKHRSVTIAEDIARHLAKKEYNTILNHRDINRL